MNIDIAKKWPEKVGQRSFIKEHSFLYRLYVSTKLKLTASSLGEEMVS